MQSSELLSSLGQIDIYLIDQVMRGRVARGDVIFDAGCGHGRNLAYFLSEGFEVLAVDADRDAVAAARRLAAGSGHGARADIRAESLETASFTDGRADVVVSSAVLHFARNDEQFDGMLRVRWTPSFGPKSGLAKVEPAGSVLVVVVSCELGCRPGPGTRNGPTPVRGDGVQVAAGAPRSGVGAERRTWRRSSTPAPGAEAARALMRRGTSTSSHRTRPASDSPTTYAVARHCRSGSSARFPRAPRSANHRGAGRSPHT